MAIAATSGAFGGDERHAGAPVRARDGDAVDDRLVDAWAGGERGGDFGCRDVLALPAKRVADAVDEGVEALGVAAHQIAGAHPGVAGGEDIAQDFPSRCPSLCV